ncbi:hypothetical protein M422DRAFT_47975 [Sphaerobolus stellatus SS14]|uniref:Solute carrier family 40 protein n=1 Tax=Sphaerobolus stellatus (strain SS14) TaxID=990650 RepID=A0A0C9UJ52_SPHS4|nr:hypothetical protein M422DRAFT_47975 [Sphaerobolus stellatus SS14]
MGLAWMSLLAHVLTPTKSIVLFLTMISKVSTSSYNWGKDRANAINNTNGNQTQTQNPKPRYALLTSRLSQGVEIILSLIIASIKYDQGKDIGIVAWVAIVIELISCIIFLIVVTVLKYNSHKPIEVIDLIGARPDIITAASQFPFVFSRHHQVHEASSHCSQTPGLILAQGSLGG